MPTRFTALSWLRLQAATPKWRNWQTRRTQNPVGFTARVGSIPTFGTRFRRRLEPQGLKRHAQALILAHRAER
jgi:hypothetical protein